MKIVNFFLAKPVENNEKITKSNGNIIVNSEKKHTTIFANVCELCFIRNVQEITGVWSLFA